MKTIKPDSEKAIVRTFSSPRKTWDKIVDAAAKEQVTISKFINTVIEKHFNQEGAGGEK